MASNRVLNWLLPKVASMKKETTSNSDVSPDNNYNDNIVLAAHYSMHYILCLHYIIPILLTQTLEVVIP